MSFTTIPRPHRLRADGLPHIGPCMVVHTGDLACEPGERLDPDETTVRFETDVRTRPRVSYWVARQRMMLRGQGSMLLLGVVLGGLLFALLRATLGVSIAAPTNRIPAQPAPTEASPPHTTEHFRQPESTLLPHLLVALGPAPAAVAEPRSRAEARAQRAKLARKHRRAALASCDPPFRFDAAGIKRIKRACL